MAIKTITLTGAEVEVFGLDGSNAHIRNDGTTVIYAAKSAGIAAGADGVLSIPAGTSAAVYGISGKVFLLGTGSAMVVSTDYTENPFKAVSACGSTDAVTDAAEIVVLDSLQGGVPFSEMVISGDDIIDQEINVNVCGKNLIPYPYYHTSFTINGVNFTDNGDGSITANGTATDNVVFYCSVRTTDKFYLPSGNYFISGNTTQNARIDVVYTDKSGNAITAARDCGNGAGFAIPYNVSLSVGIVVFAGNVYNNAVFRPQIGIGSAATSYEPYSGNTTVITPDNNPYKVAKSILQQDGSNTISVSAGKISVIGAKKNVTIRNIWEKLNELSSEAVVTDDGI